MVVNGVTLNASSYQSVISSDSGSLSVPVKSDAVIYSQMQYVHGKEAEDGQSGVPLNKVRILNTLIDQLVTMKANPDTWLSQATELTDSQKDALIDSYQKQIQTFLAQASSLGLAGVTPEPGALFSIFA